MPDPRLVPYYEYPDGPQIGMVMVDGPPEVVALYANAGPPTDDPPPPFITQLWVTKCPNPTCEWESDGELTKEEAVASYDYHLKWIVHDEPRDDQGDPDAFEREFEVGPYEKP